VQYLNESSKNALRTREMSLINWLVASHTFLIRLTYDAHARPKCQVLELFKEVGFIRSTDQGLGFGLPTAQVVAIVPLGFESFRFLDLAAKGLY